VLADDLCFRFPVAAALLVVSIHLVAIRPLVVGTL
jgi:hypothetical protein